MAYNIDNPLNTSMSGILACARQRNFYQPADLTVDMDAIVPILRTPWKMVANNTDFTTTGRNPTIALVVARGHKIDTVWAVYSLPAQYARDLTDKVAYDSLPGINCILQIEATINASLQIETVLPTAIIQRLIDSYGIDQFKLLANKYWGGFTENGVSGPLQTLTGLNTTTISNNEPSRNEIFPKTVIHLPVPICLFHNKERFTFFLALETPLDLKFIFRDTKLFMTRTKNATVSDMADSIDIYLEMLNANEKEVFWKGLPYQVETDEPYLFKDNYFETFIKNFAITADLRIPIRPSLCKRLQAFPSLKDWETGTLYFGPTVAQSVSNSIGAMISATNAAMNAQFTINLGTGTFVQSGTDHSGTLSIVGWTNGGSQFELVWNRTAQSQTRVTIKSVTPFGTFGDLFMDLSTYATNISSGGFNNVLQAGMIFLCKSFTLDIRPFTASTTNIDNYEVASISYGPAKKLARGFFSFNPAPATTDNRTAFWRVINVERHNLLTNDGGTKMDGFAFDFFASRPVPSTNSVNPLVERDFVRIARNQFGYYDLDGKWPIEINELQFEKTGSNADIYDIEYLNLSRQWKIEKPHPWSAPVDIDFGYYSLFDRKHTDGYTDFRVPDIVNYIIKLKNVRIQYDANELTDLMRELNSTEINILSLQWSMRVFQSVDNYLSTVRNPIEIGSLNSRLINSVLGPNKIYIPPEQPLPPVAQRGGLTSAKPVSQLQSSYTERTSHANKRRRYDESTARAYFPDNYSASNRVVEPRNYF